MNLDENLDDREKRDQDNQEENKADNKNQEQKTKKQKEEKQEMSIDSGTPDLEYDAADSNQMGKI